MIADSYRREIEELRQRVAAIEKVVRSTDMVGDTAPQAPDSEAAGGGGEKCPNCDDVGWYAQLVHGSLHGEVEQVQCEWCYTMSNSRFNRSRLAVAAVSPTKD